MNKMLKFATMGAIIGGAAALTMPAHAQQGVEWTPEKCKAEFVKYDANRDDRLDATEGKDYSKVQSQVDTDKDGNISADEYITACTGGVFKNMQTQG